MRRAILILAGAVFPAVAADLSVERIEAVQAVQMTDYSIRFVAGKKTVARVFVKVSGSGGAPYGEVTGVLRGYRGTSELPGSPLKPFNGPVAGQASPNREQTDHSLNFVLPDAWTESGTLALTAEINPSRSVPEDNYDNNTSTASISFVPGGDLRLGYLRVCAASGSACPAPISPGAADWLRKVFPLRDGGVEFYPLNITWRCPLVATADERAKFLGAMSERRNLAEFAGSQLSDRLVVWVPPALFAGLAGFDPLDLTEAGRAIVVADTAAFDLQKQPQSQWGTGTTMRDAASPSITLAREVARNIGLRRTGSQESCSADDRTGEVGFDTVLMKAIPGSRFDLMGYCYPPSDNIWISPSHYRQLATADLAVPSTGSPAEYGVISGWAARDGSEGGLDSVYRVTSVSTGSPSSPSGNHCLRFFGASGRLSDYCFALSFAAGRSGESIEREYFSVKVPWPAGTVRLVLMRGESELWSVAQSGTAPSVGILSPQAGEQWSGRKTIVWTASDSGGRLLRYAVLYSSDGGNQWLPLDSGLTGAQLSVDTAEFEANAQVRLRVLASNGFETAVATTGPIEVLPSPRMEIASAALDFGRTPVGEGATQNVIVANRGSGVLKVTAVRSDQASFAPASDAVVEVPPRGVAEVPVRFSPAAAGETAGTLSITGNDAENPTLTVAVKGTGIVPRAELSASSLDFGEINVGESRNLSLVLRNTGEAPLTVSAAAFSDISYSLVSPALPLSVAPGGWQEMVVRFAPVAAGSRAGTLVFSSNDPKRVGITVTLAGSGKALVAEARAEVSSTILEFGGVALGQSKEMTFALSAVSEAPVIVSALTVSNARFVLVSPSVPFSVPAGNSVTVRIRFTPDGATDFRGTLTIVNNSTNKPSISVTLTGTGISSGTVVLQADDGTFEGVLRPPADVDVIHMVNRLTPPSYPATLTKVRIYFHDQGDGPARYDSIGLLYGALASGGTIDGTSPKVLSVLVKAVGEFNDYELPTPLTIESGDFIVGFNTKAREGSAPAALDLTSAQKGCSFVSTDGRVFSNFPVAGIFPFRAVVTLGK